LTIGGNVVGDATHRQLAPIADDLTGLILPDYGHIIPEDQPEASLSVPRPFTA